MKKVACAQLAYRGLDSAAGMARIEDNLGYLAGVWRDHGLGAKDVGLVVLGEFWLPSPAGPGDYRSSAVETSGRFAGVAGDFCRDHDCYLLANVIEEVRGGALFDSSVLVAPDGAVVLVYREIAGGLMPESPIGTPVGSAVGSVGAPRSAGLGRWIPVVETDLGRIGSVVGSDLLYPEISLGLTRAGADLVLHPCKETAATEGPWQCLKPARALEGGFALVSCNIADSTAHTSTSWSSARGHSSVVDATGATLAASTRTGEDVVVAEIDLAAVRAAREAPRFQRRGSSPWQDELAALHAGPRPTS